MADACLDNHGSGRLGPALRQGDGWRPTLERLDPQHSALLPASWSSSWSSTSWATSSPRSCPASRCWSSASATRRSSSASSAARPSTRSTSCPWAASCRMLGEEDPSDPRASRHSRPAKRLIVMGAGLVHELRPRHRALHGGADDPARGRRSAAPTIAQVVPGSPGDQAGLKSGDDDRRRSAAATIENTADASYNIRLHLGERYRSSCSARTRSAERRSVETVSVQAALGAARLRLPGPARRRRRQGGAAPPASTRRPVRDAAGIKYIVDPTRTLSSCQRRRRACLHGEAGRHGAVRRQATARHGSRTSPQPAGLPDQNTLHARQRTLNFAQGATGIRIAAQYPFTETRSYGPFDGVEQGLAADLRLAEAGAQPGSSSWVKGAGYAPVSGPIGIAQATGEVVDQAGWKQPRRPGGAAEHQPGDPQHPAPADARRRAYGLRSRSRCCAAAAASRPSKEAMVHLVGMVAMLILVVVLSYFDVARIVRGDTLFRRCREAR